MVWTTRYQLYSLYPQCKLHSTIKSGAQNANSRSQLMLRCHIHNWLVRSWNLQYYTTNEYTRPRHITIKTVNAFLSHLSSNIAINTFIRVALTFQEIFQKIQHSCHLKEKHKLNTMLLFKCRKKVKNFLTCENIKTLCPSSLNFFNILANKTNLPEPSVNSLNSKWPFSFFLASWRIRDDKEYLSTSTACC